jgi:ACS family D-galactonate transporter-like MFS transporter
MLTLQNEERPAEKAVPVTERPTRIRYYILVLILLATILNFVNRSSLGIVAPYMSKDIVLDKMQMGQIFAVFSLAYSLALVPGGIVVDIFGPRIVYVVSLIGWSIATMTQGIAHGFGMLFGSRLAIGALEAPAFPANARAVAMWFPTGERGSATSIYVMGQYIGTPLVTGLLLWITTSFGWRAVFYSTGVAGIVLGIIVYLAYRDPLKHPAVNRAEMAHIRDGGGLIGSKERERFNWKKAITLLSQRQIIAVCIGKYCSNTILVFFTTWFMTFLVEERHMPMVKVGIYQALPFLGATVGILTAGFFSDYFIRRGYSMSTARKAPLIIGSLLGTLVILTNFVHSNEVIIGILTLTFFAQGVGASSWAAVAEIAPRQYIGLTSSITSLAANLTGVSTPLLIGYILHVTGQFFWAINIIGILCLVGAFAYSFLLGPLYRIEID